MIFSETVSYRYDAFGNLIEQSGTAENDIRFSAKRYNSDISLSYFGARYYDALTGRFISRDPMEYIDGPNMYILATNNPLFWIDPWGLDTYYVNRKLGGDEPVGSYVLFSHTFIATTDKQGNLQNTYSWGNDVRDLKTPTKFFKNAPNDIVAAKKALKKGFALKAWGKELDSFIEAEYQETQKPNHPSRHPWAVDSCCKHEANNLIENAKEKMGQSAGRCNKEP
ncbi:RHS repeat-associated core domain-containing protein [bacterium]|nr:RHS repeat-associated core domain-containing protein [bacterium]MCP5461684.1 RHS repeat-associated core domain-containing protein [bacterium]